MEYLIISYYINPEVTNCYVCLWLFGFVVFDFRMSPTQYAHTVRYTDGVMCCYVLYSTVLYGTCNDMVRHCTVPYRTVWYIYMVRSYCDENAGSHQIPAAKLR